MNHHCIVCIKEKKESFQTFIKIKNNLKNKKNEKIKKNETELIKCSKKRFLTAKAVRFKRDCIIIIGKQNNLSIYSEELKPLKKQLSKVLEYLIFDEKKTLKEIKELIKKRTLLIEKKQKTLTFY